MTVINIIAPALSKSVLKQRDFFLDRSLECHIYIQSVKAQNNVPTDSEEILARREGLHIFHYVGNDYPLLQTIRHIQQGKVVLDLRDAVEFSDAPAHYADICVVASVACADLLRETLDYPKERIFILNEEDEALFWDAALQWVESREPFLWKGSVNEQEMNNLEEVILIRDPSMNGEAVLQRLRQSIRKRRAEHGSMYGSEVMLLGPSALYPGMSTQNSGEDFFLILSSWVEDLMVRARLQEPQFHSRMPLIGPLIVAVRRGWNWMSAKWYVRGWMDQQVNFNIQIVELLQILIESLENSERRLRDLEHQWEQFANRGE